MCGIAGIFSLNSTVSPEWIKSMTDIIRHRGPDDSGFLGVHTKANKVFELIDNDSKVKGQHLSEFSNPVNLMFGHRRLAIIDVSLSGHQPMSNKGKSIWVVYNGEIYNYIELKEELKLKGYTFETNTDTEVLLASYEEWGEKCVHKFNGMWAFAIYDTKVHSLFIARDRFGVKPLYYWVASAGTFCFGSEIKQFTAFPGWKPRINPQRTYDFLSWGLTDHSDETLFSGVYQLRPGHLMCLDVQDYKADADGRLPARKWYDLQPGKFSGNFDEAAAEFKELLTDSVRLRLRADVSVGSCLSGGLDSSSIVCLMNQFLHEKEAASLQKTFSACSNVKRFDESEWINEVIRETEVDAHYVCPPLDKLFAELPAITWHQDEPFASTSIYAQWNVFRLAAQNGVKVMLDGQGADEQLAGYHGYFGPRFAGLLRSGRLIQLWNEIQDTKRLHGYSEFRALMYMANVLLPNVIKQPLRAMNGKTHAAPAWLNMSILGATARDPLADLGNYTDSIQAMSKAQLTATNLQMLLHWEDRDSMAHSIESRVPYLDYRLVEFVLGLPDDFKLANGITKRVQRAGMSGVLPDRIRDRIDKLGFVTPEEVWVREQATDVFRGKLRQAVDTCQGILGDASLTVLDDMISGKKTFSSLPWRLISFGEWMKTFSVSRI